MTALFTKIKYYFLIAVYSLQYLFLHLINLVLHPDRYRLKSKVSVPPPCLYQEDFGTHQYAKLSRSKFHYVEKGDRNNRLLLLIHGYPEFWYSWRFQLKDLSSYYWVVAIDVKGYGDSDKPSSRTEYTIPVLVEELYDFLTAIGRKKCSIVTHGMGGMVGWFFIHQYPDVVENFISISSAHPLSFVQEMTLNRVPNAGWYYFCQLPYFPEREAMKQDLIIFEKIFSRLLNSKRGNVTKQDIDAFKYTFSRQEDWVGPINHLRTLLRLMKSGKRPVKKASVPTLFIVGNCDPYYSLEMICKSSEYVENFTLKIVEGGGHFLPQEMPNYINSLILDFLKMPEEPVIFQDVTDSDGSLFRKMWGAGRTVVHSTVNYGNHMGKRLIGQNSQNPYKIMYF